jgi:hypothetical protein
MRYLTWRKMMHPIVEPTLPEQAFPANVIGKFLPKMEDIPEEFRQANKWSALANGLWAGFISATKVEFHPKEGVDAEVAWKHFLCVIGSYEPSHQHKMAGAGYLLSEWFEDFHVVEDEEEEG